MAKKLCVAKFSLEHKDIPVGSITADFRFFFFFLSFVFLGPHPRHMEVPRQGVELELQRQACATAIAMPDPSRVCDLHHSSQQHWVLNPRGEARDQTRIFMDTSRVH